MRGNSRAAGHRNAACFPQGHEPWNKGLVGTGHVPANTFPKGHRPHNYAEVGSVRIRTDKSGQRRAFVKTAERSPGAKYATWIERARLVWETANGPLPDGMVVHHRNHDPMDDSIGNLEALTRAAHIKHHHAHLVAAKRSARQASVAAQ
jgi:hypothetical protein